MQYLICFLVRYTNKVCVCVILNLVVVGWYTARRMGYLGFFYIESKLFELSGRANGFATMTEWGRGQIGYVEMGFIRLKWLYKSMEELVSRSAEMGACHNHRVRGSVMFLQKRKNGFGNFMEIVEFDCGGRRSHVVTLKGREGCGWKQ